jgi:hypothetical protein
MSKLKTNAQNLEIRHDTGEDMLDYFDTAKASRRNHAKAHVNLDLHQLTAKNAESTEQEKAFDTDGTDFHEPAEPDHNPC